MLQNIGNFFRRTIQRQENKQIPPISQEDKFQINMFSQNLDTFSSISRDSNCGPLLSRLINQFPTTFKNITPDHLLNGEIKLILEKYSQLCSELGILALHDKSNLSETLFKSLTFIYSLFGYIPKSESYFSFFCGIIQEIKKNSSLFDKSIQFLTCLFKSTGFFTEFLKSDGFSLIFSSFFIQENVDTQQEVFLRLLFKTVSMEYYKSSQNANSRIQNLKFFYDLLSHQTSVKYSFKNSCLFFSYYIIAFLPACQTLLTSFNSYGGFSLLNELFIHNCPEAAHECYEILMIETDLDQIVLANLNQLFLNEETGTELRSSLVPLLSVQTNNINQTYQKLSATIPLTKYLLRPPKLDNNSLNTLSQIISSFIKIGNIDFKQFLAPILNLIKFPENDEIPIDSYLNILIENLNSNKINCDLLVKENFLDFFLFDPNSQEIASYYQNHKIGLKLFLSIYESDACNSNTKCKIFHKFIQSSQFVDDKTFYIEFISSLLSFQFSSKIFKSLLMYLNDQFILALLIKETKKHSDSFNFFIENDGFFFIDNFIDEIQHTKNEDNNSKFVNIMKFISSLTFFSPHEEVDEWLNKQPVDSKLFKCCSSEFLSQMAFGFSTTSHSLFVPSLLPFISDFDSSSPYNLYLAGKFGVPACIKRRIPLEKIPHLSEISNRYVSSHISKMLFEGNPKKINAYIDPSMPDFSLFELTSSSEPSYVVYQRQYASLSFWYFTPTYTNPPNTKTKKNSIFKSKFQLVSCQITSLEVIDNETLLAKSNRDKLKISSCAGKWHHVIIIFHMRRNIAYKCEIIVDKKHAGILKVDLQSIPSIVTFGSRKNPLPSPLYISSNIFLSESMITEDQIDSIYKSHLIDFISLPTRCYSSKSNSAIFVNYLGFASYFRTSINIEKLFTLLEKVGSKKVSQKETYDDLIGQFESVFLALLNLRVINNSNFKKFWGRMILSFCRCKDLIENKLYYFGCDLLDTFFSSSSSFLSSPKSVSKKVTTAIFLLLSNVEFFSVFSYDSIKDFLAHILELKTLDWKLLESLKITDFLLTALRSGIDDNLKLLIVPLLSISTQVDPTPAKLRSFFNAVVSIGDWTFDKVDLIHENVNYSAIQSKLLFVFVNSAKTLQDNTEIFTLNQILMFMMLFLDERAICLAELIAIYSYKNPKFIAMPNQLLTYVFSTMAIENNKIWKVAFSILSGNLPQPKFIKGFQIRRPHFMPVILDMLNALAANCAHSIIEKSLKKNENDAETNAEKNEEKNENENAFSIKYTTPVHFNLISKVINVLLSLDRSQFVHFSQQQCITTLHSLLFLGITPNSYSADEKSERTIKIWSTFSLQPPTKAEIKQITSLTTQSALFQPIVPENLCYEPKATSPSSKTILYFPDDIDDVNPDKDMENSEAKEIENKDDCISLLDDFMKSTLLLELFVSIIIESENTSSLFFDLVSGNALMYNRYSKMIAQELVLAVLARFSSSLYFTSNSYFEMINSSNSTLYPNNTNTTAFNTANFVSLLKNVMLAIHKTAVSGVFNDKYLTFLTAILDVISQPSAPQAPISVTPSLPSQEQGASPSQLNMAGSSYVQLASSVSSSPTLFSSLSLTGSAANSNSVIIDLLLSDDKFVKIYKDILLSAFCYISEGDSNPLFQLLIQYKDTVFKQSIFNDNKFSSLWLHVTRPRGGNAPERIECMTAFMHVIDSTIMSNYSPMEVQAEWISFKTSKNGLWMNNYFDSVMTENEYKANRISRMNAIIDWKQKCYTQAAKYELFSRIYRSCNFSVEQNMVIQDINSSQRLNERLIFKFSLLARKREMQEQDFVPASYHLSPLSYPVCQSRSLSPSPFTIKSPSPTSKVPKSFFIPYDDYDDYEENEEDEISKIESSENPDKSSNDSSEGKMQSSNEPTIESAKKKRRRRHHESKQRIKAINQRGLMNCSPEWSFLGYNEERRPFYSPFEYSAVIEQGPSSLLKLFENAFQEYGPFVQRFDVNFFYFIHPLPSVLFVTNNSILLVVLAKGELQLISHPQNPVAFLPFTESVALGEFSQTSLFCGHVVIITRMDKIVRLQKHFYIHKKVGLCISTIGASNLILLFSNHNEMTTALKLISKKICRRSYPPSHLLFTVQTVQQATFLWQNNVISNFDYLMLLNAFGGRSFADLSQYPIVPWVVSPTTLEERNLSLPMGQLSENRAKHYDQTYELSSPLKYFYGFHYSLPGIVFWLLMRLPPFTFFQWDLNNGWDNSQRLFVSIADAWNSAAVSNPSDLKELVPAIYQTPEALINSSNITLGVPDNVVLPEWSNGNPYFFSENGMKYLNESKTIHLWINLIFGFQQNGEEAIQAKNLFHPSSYHTCKCEDVEMDEDAFRSQVINFGQCPLQLFNKPHPSKMFKAVKKNWNDVEFELFDSNKVEVLNPLQLQMKMHLYSAIWIGGKTVGKQITLLLPLTMMKRKIFEIKREKMNKRNEKLRSNKRNSKLKSGNYEFHAASTAMIKMECSGSYYYFDIDHDLESLSLFNDSLPNSQSETILPNISKPSSNTSITITQTPNVNKGRYRFKSVLSKSPSFALMDSLDVKAAESQSKEFISVSNEKLKGVSSSPLQMASNKNNKAGLHGVSEDTSISNSTDDDQLEFVNEKTLVLPERKPVFVKYSYDFAYVSHLAVSDDGFFLVVSFDFGLVDIYQIVFEKGKPIDISRFSSFSEFGSVCTMSSIFSQDYLCASVLKEEKTSLTSIVIWNYATQMRHRTIKLEKDFVPIQIAFDQFDGVLSVLSRNEIRQYSSNAVLLRSLKFGAFGQPILANSKQENEAKNNNSILICNNNILICNGEDMNNLEDKTNIKKKVGDASLHQVYCTCMSIIGLDFAFDKRLTVVGNSDGSITVLAVDSDNFNFKVIRRINENASGVGIVTITSSMTDVPRFVTVDERGVVRVFEISAFEPKTCISKCNFCENPQTTICKKCQTPICDSCRYEGSDFCFNCGQGTDILSFGHF